MLTEKNIYAFAVALYVFTLTVMSASYMDTGISNTLSILYNVSFYFLIGDSIFNVLTQIIFSKRKIIYLLVGFTLIVLLYLLKNTTLLWIFFVVLGYPQELDSKILAKFLYFSMLLGILVVFIGFTFGIFNDEVGGAHYEDGIRHSFGFTTANTLGNYILLILLLKIYISWDVWKLKDTIVWSIVIITTYVLVNSRASFFCSILAILLVLFFKNKTIYMKNLKSWLPIISFTVLLFISLYSMIYFSKYQNNSYSFFNELFSGRLYYMTSFYNSYGISWFGNSIRTISAAEIRQLNGYTGWFGLDNSYSYIAINGGIICLILFWLIFFFANIKSIKDKNWGGIIVILVISILGLSENYIRLLNLDFVIFIFASYVAGAPYRKTKVANDSYE